jgi:signal transduction histidine kinase/ActR/RegA family two-component response regulator
MRHKNGTWRLLESTASTITDASGKVGKLVIVNRDITDRKRLEEQYRQAQKMEAVGRLSGGIAHDFNNLLGVMVGFAEILQASVADSPLLADSVEEILKAGKRAGSLTRQLLAFSRQQVLEPKILELNSTIAEIEKMLRRIIGEDVQLETILDPAAGRIKADEGQIEQVLLNLAVNARDAMPSGGKLTIETRNAHLDDEFARRHSYPIKNGDYILFTVTDTGVGMNAEVLAHMFEPFFTTKEKGKGTGLGLATVYGIVKQSGGYIDVASEIGSGTTFKIFLPRVDEEPISESTQKASPTVATSKQTILVVEDEESLLKSTCSLLRAVGYEVLEALGGSEALRISQERNRDIQVVLTDVVMPGMDGVELVQHLIAQRPSLKVIYMSGYTGQSAGRSAAFSPDALFLMKPFTREELVRKIQDALQAQTVGATA